jgi:hypothetical protein
MKGPVRRGGWHLGAYGPSEGRDFPSCRRSSSASGDAPVRGGIRGASSRPMVPLVGGCIHGCVALPCHELGAETSAVNWQLIDGRDGGGGARIGDEKWSVPTPWSHASSSSVDLHRRSACAWRLLSRRWARHSLGKGLEEPIQNCVVPPVAVPRSFLSIASPPSLVIIYCGTPGG